VSPSSGYLLVMETNITLLPDDEIAKQYFSAKTDVRCLRAMTGKARDQRVMFYFAKQNLAELEKEIRRRNVVLPAWATG